MEQHPVPQHIASFQFKLFGNLTARQFITLALPLTLAGAIFFSTLEPVIIKYALATIIGLVGFLVALVPVGGRPFDKWLVAFIKAIFAPTQRVWVKEKKMPEFLQVVVTPPAADEKIPQEISEKGRERLIAYLRSLPKEDESPLDVREQTAISQLNLNAQGTGVGFVPPPIIWPSAFEDKRHEAGQISVGMEANGVIGNLNAPEVKRSDVKLSAVPVIKPFEEKRGMPVGQVTEQPKVDARPVIQVPKINPHVKHFSLEGIEERLKKGTVEKPLEGSQYNVMPTTHLASDTNFSIDKIISLKEPDNKIRLVRGVGRTRVRKLHFAPPANFDLSKLPIRGERRFEISEELKRRFSFEDDSPSVMLPNEKNVWAPSVSYDTSGVGSSVGQVLPKQVRKVGGVQGKKEVAIAVGQELKKAVAKGEEQARFAITDKKQNEDTSRVAGGAQIIPLTSVPNVISGLVTEDGGTPIEGAVLVVRDAAGIPVRALKTNKLGQFLSATPLSSGNYMVEVESDRAAFRPTSLSLNGQVVAPLGLVGGARLVN